MTDATGKWEPGLEHAELSDVGLRRNSNQDSLAVSLARSEGAWQSRGHLFMVADGMGAHAAGELASKLSVDIVPLTYHKMQDQPAIEAIFQAMNDANDKIHQRGQANAEFHGMGTTTSVLLLLPQGSVVAHVGDSRVYRLRQRRLDQLTFDHSLAWEMAASGQTRGPGAPVHIPRNIITRSLGPNAQVQVDLEGPFPIETNDVFLLCSDGLTGQVEDAEIASVLANLSPTEAARLLVDLANLRGGPDNITVLIARATQPTLDAAAPATGERTGGLSPKSRGMWQQAVGYVVAVALLLAAIGLISLGRYVQALVAAGLGIFLIVEMRWRRKRHAVKPRPPVESRSYLGRGPYAAADAEPDEAFAKMLRATAEQLFQATQGHGWTIDWGKYESLSAAAEKAMERKNYSQAVRSLAAGISFLMSELRQQRAKRSEASSGGSAGG